MQWSGGTKLTQGSVFIVDDKIKTCLPDRIKSNFSHALVVSHDCDIAQDPETEPLVEAILGVLVEVSDGNYEHGKNPRMLHLSKVSNNNNKTIEVRACHKIMLPKELLGQHMPDISFQLQSKEKRVLQSWLSARYRRHAFPDEFNERMREIVKLISNEGKKHNKAIMSYWVNYEPEQELAHDEPYELDFFVVYSVDDIEFENEANDIINKIKKKFDGKNIGIILRKCEAYSEMEFTYRDMRTNYEYQFEHISLREENACKSN